jgi:hypothetical protein
MLRRLLRIVTFGLLGTPAGPQNSDDTWEEMNLSDVDSPELRAALEEMARVQASGLDGATVTIHSVMQQVAFQGTAPPAGNKWIVADVTFKDHKMGFGLAGVQLIDGEEEEAEIYGGDPYKVYLEEDSSLMKDQSGDHLIGPWGWHYEQPIRVLLVYSAPEKVRTVGLFYWGQIIVDRPYEVEGN